MKRKALLASCIMLVLVLASLVGLRVFVRPTVVLTEERVQQIRPDMTLAAVEAILGGPPGDYTGKDGAGLLIKFIAGQQADKDVRLWVGPEEGAAVEVDAEGRVRVAEHFRVNLQARPWYERVLRWLGLG